MPQADCVTQLVHHGVVRITALAPERPDSCRIEDRPEAVIAGVDRNRYLPGYRLGSLGRPYGCRIVGGGRDRPAGTARDVDVGVARRGDLDEVYVRHRGPKGKGCG